MNGIGITSRVKPGASTSTIASGRQAERAVLEPAAGDDEDRVGVLDPGDEGLLAVQEERPSRLVSEVLSLWEFEPASASVIAKASFVVPAPMPRSQRSF